MTQAQQWHRGNYLVRKPLLLALTMLLQAGMQAALACGYTPGHGPTEEELFAKAAVVLVGRVSVVDEVKIEHASASSPPTVTVEGTVRVEEVLKGTPPADNKVTAVVRLGCGIPLLAGLDFVLFLDRGKAVHDGGVPGSNVGAIPIFKGPNGRLMSPFPNKLEKLRERAKQQQ
jgi:hypothetical protein